MLIFKSKSGSGGYMDCTVFAEIDGDINIVLESKGVFQGDLYVSGKHLIEKRGSQAIIYEWNGICMTAVPLEIEPYKPYSPNTKHIYFSIDYNDNIVIVPSQEVSIVIGHQVLLTRIGRGTTDRILYSEEGVIEYVDGIYIGKKAGATRISIIPSGYNWDKAVDIEVTVKEA